MAIRNETTVRGRRPGDQDDRDTMRYHAILLLISLALAPVFSWALQGQAFGPDFLPLLALIFLQMELFAWLGARFFARWEGHSSENDPRAVLLRLAVFFGMVLAIALLINIFFIFYQSPPAGSGRAEHLLNSMRANYRDFLLSAAIGIMFGTIAFFYIQWRDGLKREQRLREEKLIFRYETLKNQVNPHFLFNSLNTLSSLVHQDPGLSERFIHKLSSIYRYILDNSEAEMAGLDSEIRFVEDYFYLQKIRDQEKIQLEIQVNNPEGYETLPMSLQLLVENALKHNTATRSHPLVIRISQEEDGMVTVRNKLQEKATLAGSPKAGLRNLRERMKLAMGRDIEVLKTPEEFLVKIPARKRKATTAYECIDH